MRYSKYSYCVSCQIILLALSQSCCHNINKYTLTSSDNVPLESKITTIQRAFEWSYNHQDLLEECIWIPRYEYYSKKKCRKIIVDNSIADYMNYVMHNPNVLRTNDYSGTLAGNVIADIYIGDKHYTWRSHDFIHDESAHISLLFPFAKKLFSDKRLKNISYICIEDNLRSNETLRENAIFSSQKLFLKLLDEKYKNHAAKP